MPIKAISEQSRSEKVCRRLKTHSYENGVSGVFYMLLWNFTENGGIYKEN